MQTRVLLQGQNSRKRWSLKTRGALLICDMYGQIACDQWSLARSSILTAAFRMLCCDHQNILCEHCFWYTSWPKIGFRCACLAKERALQGLGVAMLGKLCEGSCRLQGQSEQRLGVTRFKVHDLSEISRRVGPTYALEGLCWPKQLLQKRYACKYIIYWFEASANPTYLIHGKLQIDKDKSCWWVVESWIDYDWLWLIHQNFASQLSVGTMWYSHIVTSSHRITSHHIASGLSPSLCPSEAKPMWTDWSWSSMGDARCKKIWSSRRCATQIKLHLTYQKPRTFIYHHFSIFAPSQNINLMPSANTWRQITISLLIDFGPWQR